MVRRDRVDGAASSQRAELAWSSTCPRRDQTGFATVWAVVWMGLCTAVGWIGLLAAAVAACQHRVDGVADLASLAGASALHTGADACAAARTTAEVNDLEVLACSVHLADVVVTVEGTVRLPFGLSSTLRSSARAGPSGLR
jgi:secretion/DNA translocation related TadE-like protein